MNNNKKQEELNKEYVELENSLDYGEEQEFNNLSPVVCECCGNRLSIDEWEEFESICEQCMWESTSGLIDDQPEEEM